MRHPLDYHDNDNNGEKKNIEHANGFFYSDEDCSKVGNM